MAVHPQIRVVLGFVLFLLLFLCCIVSFGDHWRFFGRVLSIVVLVHLYRCSSYRCGARNSHRCILPDHVVVSLFFAALASLATFPFPLCTPDISLRISIFLSEFLASNRGAIVLRRAGVPLPAPVSSYLLRSLCFSRRTRNSDKYEC